MYRRIVNPQRLSRAVSEQIRDLIRNEKLKPGEQLPSEEQLASLLGVSRPTVREAVKSLVSLNVVEIRRGRGTFISERPGLQSDPLGLDFVSEGDVHTYLIEFRQMIEPQVGRLAAVRAGKKEVHALEQSLQRMKDGLKLQEVHLANELEFHRTIAESSRNPVVLRIVPMVLEAIRRAYRDAPRTSQDHSAAYEEHLAVLDAIRGGDPDGAERAMHRHLERSRERTILRQQAFRRRAAGRRDRGAPPRVGSRHRR